MKKSTLSLFSGLLLFSGAASAVPFTEAPQIGHATSAAILYTFNSDGSITTQVDPSIKSTDGIEDTLAAVRNNSGHVINSLTLSGIGINGEGIFNFDRDGQSPYGNTYNGQYFDASKTLLDQTTFSGISGSLHQTGTINFPGMPDGDYGWFVLEDQISFTAPPLVLPEPSTYAMILIGLGLLGFTAHQKKKNNRDISNSNL